MFQGLPIKIESLPAEAVFSLWEKKPTDNNQKPDMNFRIVLN
jgi:hypothetical protein